MTRRRLHQRRAAAFLGLAAVVLVAIAAAAPAQTQNTAYWNQAGSAAWSNTNNWTLLFNSGPNGSVINNGATATISSGDNVTDNSNGGVVWVGGSSGALGGVGGNGYVNMSGGTLNGHNGSYQYAGPAISEVVGYDSGSGVFTQSGGLNCPFVNVPGYYAFSALTLGWGNGAYGEYDMSGGALGVNAIMVGANCSSTGYPGPSYMANAGTGVFNQTGGFRRFLRCHHGVDSGRRSGGGRQLHATGTKYATTYSSVGYYTLGPSNASSATATPLLVGGVEAIGVNGTGTFTQNCGTNAIVGGGLYGYGQADNTKQGFQSSQPFNNVNGILAIGFWNAGAFARSGNGATFLGAGVGTYNLNGGLLTGGTATSIYANPSGGIEAVGVNGTGTFNQSGGTNYCTLELDVGGANGSDTTFANYFSYSTQPAVGTYNLTNGLLMGAAGMVENVGNNGTGTFNQTGGSNYTHSIDLGGEATAITGTHNTSLQSSSFVTPGTYNLAGGLLQATSISASGLDLYQQSPAYFNFTGGTLQAGPSVTVGGETYLPGLVVSGMPITVGTAASNLATIDVNGYVSGTDGGWTYSGPGQLRVIDSVGGGMLVLDGNQNLYTGGTIVSSGTLQVTNAQALPATGVLTVGGPVSVMFSAKRGRSSRVMPWGKQSFLKARAWRSQVPVRRSARRARHFPPWRLASAWFRWAAARPRSPSLRPGALRRG